jgi:hypothetical protein
MEIKANDQSSLRCPYCHEELLDNSVTVTCPECQAIQHKACVMFSNSCAVNGCKATWTDMARGLMQEAKLGRTKGQVFPCPTCGSHRKNAEAACPRCNWMPRAQRPPAVDRVAQEQPFGHSCPFCDVCDYETREVTKDCAADPIIKILSETAHSRFFLRVCSNCGHVSLFCRRN